MKRYTKTKKKFLEMLFELDSIELYSRILKRFGFNSKLIRDEVPYIYFNGVYIGWLSCCNNPRVVLNTDLDLTKLYPLINKVSDAMYRINKIKKYRSKLKFDKQQKLLDVAIMKHLSNIKD